MSIKIPTATYSL